MKLIKTITLNIIGLITVLTIACGSSGPAAPIPLIEGDGPALSISQTDDIETLVKHILFGLIYYDIRTFSELNNNMVSEAAINTLCATGSVTAKTNGTQAAEGITMSGLLSFSKISESNISRSESTEVIISGHKHTIDDLFMSVVLDGTSSYLSKTSAIGDNLFQKICSQTNSNDDITSISIDESLSGSISISGEIGGALSFDISENHSSQETISVTGHATFVSGGETSECKLGFSDTEMIYTVECM